MLSPCRTAAVQWVRGLWRKRALQYCLLFLAIRVSQVWLSPDRHPQHSWVAPRGHGGTRDAACSLLRIPQPVLR